MKIAVIVEDSTYLEYIRFENQELFTINDSLLQSNDKIKNIEHLDFPKYDVIIFVNPSQILDDNSLHNFIIQVDFELNQLIVLKQPKISNIPVTINHTQDQLIVKICEGFQPPNQPTKLCFQDLEILNPSDQTAIFSPQELKNENLHTIFKNTNFTLSSEWNYFLLENYPDLQNELHNKNFHFKGTRSEFFLTTLTQPFYYQNTKIIFDLIARILTFHSSIFHSKLHFDLIHCENRPSKLISCEDSAISQLEKVENLTVFASQAMVKIEQNATPKYGKALISRIERFPTAESCVVNTHPFHSVHAAIWAKEMTQEIVLFCADKLDPKSVFNSFKEDFWRGFYQYFFVKEVESLIQLDIFKNEKIAPIFIDQESFLNEFQGVDSSIETTVKLYKFRCQQFSLIEGSYFYEIGAEFPEFNKDFASIKENLSCFYKLFEFNFEKMPPCDPNEWNFLEIDAPNVGELVRILEERGIGVSSLFSTAGKFLYPGNTDAVLIKDMEIIIDTEDGEELPNVIIK